MKYLLIPIEEIDSRIKEIKRELYQGIKTNELNSLKSKGEIVKEIPHTHGKDYKLLKTII